MRIQEAQKHTDPTDSDADLDPEYYLKSELRIRIRIGSGLNRVSGFASGFGSWIRIQEGKSDPQK
jgi:hypothetical protein